MPKRTASFRVLILFTLLAICGLPLIYKLDIKLNPEAWVTSLTVTFSWPNAEPRVIEQEATSIIEALAARVQGIKQISSRSGRGTGQVSVILDKKTDADAVRFELSTLIRQAWTTVPRGVTYPVISINRPDDQEIRPLLTVVLNASDSASAIQQYAELIIKPAVAAVKGISRIEVFGATPEEWQVVYDPELLTVTGVKPPELVYALQTALYRDDIGSVRERPGGESMPLVIRTRHAGGKELLQVPVTRMGDRIIRVGDLAEIVRTQAEKQQIYRINGLNTINILIYAARGENNLVAARNAKSVIGSLQKEMPEGYSLMLQDDSTDYIYNELKNIGVRTLIAFAGLVLMVLIVTRKLRYLLLIAITLFGNLCVAVIFYYLARLEIHLYALAGITVSLGLMTDNMIIMADHLRIKGNKKAFLAIFAGTISTISSLTIIFFLGEQIKANLTDFAMVVIINQSVSLFTSLFVVSAMMDVLKLDRQSLPSSALPGIRWRRLVVRGSYWYSAALLFLRRHRGWAVLLLIMSFGLPVYLLPDRLEGDRWWNRAYNKTLGSRFYIEKVKPVSDKLTGGTLRLFTEKVFEGSYMGKPSEPYLHISAQMPLGTTIDQADAIVATMERYLSGFNQIRLFKSEISPRRASITVYFTREHQQSSFPLIIKSDVMTKAMATGGAYWVITGYGDLYSNTVTQTTGNNYIRLLGYNYEKLNSLAEQLSVMLMRNPRNQQVYILSEPSSLRPDNVEFNMSLDLEKMIALHLPVGTVTSEMRNRSLYQPWFATLKGSSGTENFRLKRGRTEADVWSLAEGAVQSDSAFYRMNEISHITREISAPVIARENQQYLFYLWFDFAGQEKTVRRHMADNLNEFRNYLPLGYSATPDAGIYRFFMTPEDKSHYWLLGLIIVIIYFICAVLFESMLQPLAVILAIPVSYIGLFLTFWLFRLNFDYGGFAAMVILSGITVNAAIYILNDYNNLVRKEGKRSQERLRLYMKAFNYKIMPIALTIVSTAIGFLPFLIGEKQSFWFALAAGTIGGVIFSILGILFFLPLFLNLTGYHQKKMAGGTPTDSGIYTLGSHNLEKP